jgi:hypothetical protein
MGDKMKDKLMLTTTITMLTLGLTLVLIIELLRWGA